MPVIEEQFGRAQARIHVPVLGHRDLEETTLYLHLSNPHLNATVSPLDKLPLTAFLSRDE